MTSAAAEFPDPNAFPPSEEQAALFESVAALQDTRLGFLHACSTYTEQPGIKSGQGIGDAANMYSSAMAEHFSILSAGMDAQELADAGKELLWIEDGQRVDFFNGLMDKPVLEKLVAASPLENLSMDLQKVLAEHADASDEQAKQGVLNLLAECFSDGLVEDTQKLLDHFSNSRRTKIKRLGKIAGKHAIDVGKTALGTAAGIAILQAMTAARRRR